ELKKVDKDNNEIVLAGAVFELQSADGKTLEEGLLTNSEGKLIVENLKPGTYQFVETKAPEHYKLDETPIVFTIEKGQEITLTVKAENELITGSVELTKLDNDDDTPLAGAVFELRDEAGEIILEGLETNTEGKLVVSNLKPGDYQFIETKA